MSSNFLAIACGSNFFTHKGHLPPIMLLHRHSPPRRSRATWSCPLPICSFSDVLCTALSGDCEFRPGASSGIPALRHVADFSPFVISFPCFLSSLPLSNHLYHFFYPPTFQPLPADPASPLTGHQDNHRLWSSKKDHAATWCVCVCAWNLNRRQKLSGCFFFRGRGMQSGTASNEATWLHGIQSLISCAYRPGSIFQFLWQAAKPITAQLFFHVSTIGAIWDCDEMKGQLPIYFFGHLTLDPRDSWLFNSTSQFDRTSLSKCVLLWLLFDVSGAQQPATRPEFQRLGQCTASSHPSERALYHCTGSDWGGCHASLAWKGFGVGIGWKWNK